MMNENNKNNANYKATGKVVNTKKVMELSQTTSCKNDPNGSYTGVPLDPNDKPVQDADDL